MAPCRTFLQQSKYHRLVSEGTFERKLMNLTLTGYESFLFSLIPLDPATITSMEPSTERKSDYVKFLC